MLSAELITHRENISLSNFMGIISIAAAFCVMEVIIYILPFLYAFLSICYAFLSCTYCGVYLQIFVKGVLVYIRQTIFSHYII